MTRCQNEINLIVTYDFNDKTIYLFYKSLQLMQHCIQSNSEFVKTFTF